ncbi:MAG: hypothetical protein PVJ02_04045 [Gemmatimonadota bacterium]
MEEPAGATDWQEGVWEYVAPTQGQSIARGGRFVFLFGPADGSASMTGEAGTYEIAGDTVKNTVRFSTDPDRIGYEYWWTLESESGDTLSYVVMNTQGEITGRGRSIRIQ